MGDPVRVGREGPADRQLGTWHMSQDKDAQEPSMEEILSSIRRIIAEEDKERDAPAEASGRAAAAPPGRPTATREEADDDVLELTDVAEEEAPAEAPALVAAAASAPAATAEESSLKETDAVDTTAHGDGLVSEGAASASTSALARLTRAAAPDERKPSPVAGRSMDDFLTELLRPMLKEWLEQHLAEVVERIVEQEVKKLVRRAELM
jgi:hypothetical protein